VKSLLITGGSGDLGHAVVPRLLRDYRCVVAYRSAEAWTKLRDSAGSDRLAGIDDLARLDGPLYGIVLLAGAFTMGSSEVDFATMLDANLMAAVRAVTAALPHLEDGGRIVAISSAATLTQPAGMAAYVASKSALNAYLEVLAHEVQPRRITVNAILPTALDTLAMRGVMSRELLIPLDRVAETIAFLLSDAAASITGQLIAMSA
jgi:NAD(P)-dependent dehydrogenase (short-subunit alcohol dehydrogenase family)